LHLIIFLFYKSRKIRWVCLLKRSVQFNSLPGLSLPCTSRMISTMYSHGNHFWSWLWIDISRTNSQRTISFYLNRPKMQPSKEDQGELKERGEGKNEKKKLTGEKSFEKYTFAMCWKFKWNYENIRCLMLKLNAWALDLKDLLPWLCK